MTGEAATGQREPRLQMRPPVGAAGQGHVRTRRFLLTAALVGPFAGIVALLIVFQPFAGAAGGCGGG